MKLFEVRNKENDNVVAQGVIFDNGKCVVTWIGSVSGTRIFGDINRLMESTSPDCKVVRIADCNKQYIDSLREVYARDQRKTVVLSPTAKYAWDEREKLIRIFDEVELKKEVDFF